MSNINSLPKDILIKLISTIKKDTEKKLLDIIVRLETYNGQITRCWIEDCDAIKIIVDWKYKYSNTDGFDNCEYCYKIFCNKHYSEHECLLYKKEIDILP